ncbi:MAG TPA: hypothetical protein VFP54_12590 [Acidimicrobiales bacterium]|nr:hypothetical protein [Acidimicrobiales bacterium]
MSTYTYTHVYTRSQAIVDQVSVLFREAGISTSDTDKVCHGVQEKWLEAVGLYLERDGHRVYEVEARITWSSHSDVVSLEFSTDLPGWDGTASPEAIILGKRFAAVAKREGLTPTYWVLFTSTIRADPALHQRLCPQVGVSYGSSVPSWGATPTTRSLRLQDLREMGLSERSTL